MTTPNTAAETGEYPSITLSMTADHAAEIVRMMRGFARTRTKGTVVTLLGNALLTRDGDNRLAVLVTDRYVVAESSTPLADGSNLDLLGDDGLLVDTSVLANALRVTSAEAKARVQVSVTFVKRPSGWVVFGHRSGMIDAASLVSPNGAAMTYPGRQSRSMFAEHTEDRLDAGVGLSGFVLAAASMPPATPVAMRDASTASHHRVQWAWGEHEQRNRVIAIANWKA